MLQGVNEELALPLLAERPILKLEDRPHASVQGRSVLITGAGGSIGSELVRQVLRSAPARLTMVDASEFNLYEINCTVANARVKTEAVSYLADIRDPVALHAVFRERKPDIVFHAAALKHVPLLENDFNLIEAVKTNVGGTKNVADHCAGFGADLVSVSTDKAVNPSSGMGLTKRVAELYVQWRAKSTPCKFRQVRFGNVLGSNGSVVPLFRRQIAHGGPVTVTHPDMTRYLMTISEAVSLTLCASSIVDDHGGVFVLNMGKPVKIIDLAKQLIEFAGLKPYEDIDIEIVGVRPGEKIAEELFYPHEDCVATPIEGVMQAVTAEALDEAAPKIAAAVMAAFQRDAEQMKTLLKEIVPQYVGEVVF